MAKKVHPNSLEARATEEQLEQIRKGRADLRGDQLAMKRWWRKYRRELLSIPVEDDEHLNTHKDRGRNNV